MSESATKVHSDSHVPASNTAAGLALFDNRSLFDNRLHHPARSACSSRTQREGTHVKRALTVRDPATRDSLRQAFDDLGYEVIPFKKTEQAVLCACRRTSG